MESCTDLQGFKSEHLEKLCQTVSKTEYLLSLYPGEVKKISDFWLLELSQHRVQVF